jgi:membrane protein implicated in regulation of membrane protease activity
VYERSMPFAPDWYLLGFLAPLTLGLLLVLGLAVGVGDGASDTDTDLDLHGDADGHAALSVLGFGRTPFLIVAIMLLLWFGGAGLVCWFFGVPVLLALPMAAFTSYALSRASAGVLSRLLPNLETTSVKARDFRGLSGVVTLEAAQGRSGLAHVTIDGDIFQINFTSGEPLAKGQRVLIVDVDAETNVYSVCLDPTDPRGIEKWKWL